VNGIGRIAHRSIPRSASAATRSIDGSTVRGAAVVRAVAGALGAALLLVACAQEPSPTDAADGADGSAGELIVFAASSLTDALGEIAGLFEERSGVRVLLNLAGSQTLATQLVEGAPGDLFIAANAAQTDVVVAAGLVADEPVVVATNVLAIAVERGNPLGVTGLADLSRPEVIVVLPAEAVPAGRYAREVLARSGIAVRPASLEQNVRAALARVAQGEADAAIVYASDIVAAGDTVAGVPIPVEQNIVAGYPMVVLAEAADPDSAVAFAAFLRTEEAQAVLRAAGFRGP
jgi:molybdate transport system substrate-binding protein